MKTKAESNAKAKAKTKTAPKWSTNGNARSMLRRKALGSLNKLAEEIGATTISAKTAKAKRVEKFIRVLQRRLAAPTDVERLREAARSWVAWRSLQHRWHDVTMAMHTSFGLVERRFVFEIWSLSCSKTLTLELMCATSPTLPPSELRQNMACGM